MDLFYTARVLCFSTPSDRFIGKISLEEFARFPHARGTSIFHASHDQRAGWQPAPLLHRATLFVNLNIFLGGARLQQEMDAREAHTVTEYDALPRADWVGSESVTGS